MKKKSKLKLYRTRNAELSDVISNINSDNTISHEERYKRKKIVYTNHVKWTRANFTSEELRAYGYGFGTPENNHLSKESILLISSITNLLNQMVKPQKKRKFPAIVSLIKFMMPKADREEFMADLIEIRKHLEKCESGKVTRFLTYTLHLSSIVYHGLFFKLRGYFYTAKQKVNE